MLGNWKPVCAAIAQMMPGQVEIVIHDLKTNRIAHIENPFSGREVGDDSLLEVENYRNELNSDGIIEPYVKVHSDGSKIKSVSALLKDDDGSDAALLCINMKVAAFELAGSLLLQMAAAHQNKDAAILKNDWRETANQIIAKTIEDLNISLAQAKRPERLLIVKHLVEADVLDARGSADYVARALGISRAGFYDLLREAKASLSNV